MHLTVVGNPDNRRVALFSAAALAAGLPAPEVLPWRRVAAGGPLRLRPGTIVRVDSPGEDAEVARLLRGSAQPRPGEEITRSVPWYGALRRAVRRVADAAAEAGATLVNDPDDIAVLFDKSACHALLSAAGVPVPAALEPEQRVGGWESLCAALDREGWSRVFVKPRHGSSASGVLALQRMASGGRAGVQAATSVELVYDRGHARLFNSLRVRTYRDERDVAAIVDRLSIEGLHVERWFPKAGLDGRTVDLRVVVTAGRPDHVVVRGSHGPMTNLHLGGVRGDLEKLKRAAGEDAYAAAMDSCVRAAACFPGSLQVGVDLMFAPDWRRHAIAEVNAFGDLLPGLLSGGLDTYGAQIAALAEGRFPYAGAPA